MSTEWQQVPPESQFKCRKCGSDNIEYRVIESYDGGHEDYDYHCKGCDRRWYVDGSDY